MVNIEKFNEKAVEFLSNAKAALAQTSTTDEALEYRDRAEALRVFCKQSKKGLEIQNVYAEVRIRAERRGGEILQIMRKNKELEDHGGDRKSKSNSGTLKNLDKLGISKNESSRYQKIANIPEKTFEEIISGIKDQELTTALFLSLCQNLAKEQREKKKEKDLEFKAFLRKAWRRAESLSEQIAEIRVRKEELESDSIWDSDDRRDLCRILHLLIENGEILLNELEAIEKSKDKKVIDVEAISEASVS